MKQNISNLKKQVADFKIREKELILDLEKEVKNPKLNLKIASSLIETRIKLKSLEINIYLQENNPSLLKRKKNKKGVWGFNNWPLSMVYKSIIIENPYDNGYAVVKYNNNELEEAMECVNILSFFYNRHFFINEDFSENDLAVYEYIILSQEDGSEIDCFKEIFKTKYNEFCVIPESKYPELFALYNSALRQVDPFAKCIFLYRIIEFYQQEIIKEKFNTETIFNKLIVEVNKYKFVPIWIFDYKKNDYYNQITKFKKKFRYTLHDFKVNKKIDLYKFVYNQSRCGVAHGRPKINKIVYHSKNNIEKIKKANIILMLLSRLIIEKMENSIKAEVNEGKPENKYQ